MPRPRKPTAMHHLDGTYRKDRHGDRNEIEFEFGGKLRRPEHLSGKAADLWDSLARQFTNTKVGKEIDSQHLEAMCRWWARYQYLMERVEGSNHDDDLCESLERRAKNAWLSFDRIASRFGMTPSDRAKLKIVEDGGTKGGDLEEFGIVG